MKNISLVLPVLILLVALGPAPYRPEKASRVQVLTEDTDNNGRPEEYILNNFKLKVTEGNHIIWYSPGEWQIKQIQLADADNDSKPELVMVVWKKGSFGNCRPWWIKKNDDRQLTCHLFVYRLTAGHMKAVWCSSALECPIKHIDIINRNGMNELQVQEIPGYGLLNRLKSSFGSSHKSQWIWNGWGFEKIDT